MMTYLELARPARPPARCRDDGLALSQATRADACRRSPIHRVAAPGRPPGCYKASIDRLFSDLGRVVVRFRFLVVAIWIAAVVRTAGPPHPSSAGNKNKPH